MTSLSWLLENELYQPEEIILGQFFKFAFIAGCLGLTGWGAGELIYDSSHKMDLARAGALLFWIPAGIFLIKGLMALMKPNLIRDAAVAVTRKTGEIADRAREASDSELAAFVEANSEIENECTVPGLWAKAFSDAEGDIQKQKALYIRYRVKTLSSDN